MATRRKAKAKSKADFHETLDAHSGECPYFTDPALAPGNDPELEALSRILHLASTVARDTEENGYTGYILIRASIAYARVMVRKWHGPDCQCPERIQGAQSRGVFLQMLESALTGMRDRELHGVLHAVVLAIRATEQELKSEIAESADDPPLPPSPLPKTSLH